MARHILSKIFIYKSIKIHIEIAYDETVKNGYLKSKKLFDKFLNKCT